MSTIGKIEKTYSEITKDETDSINLETLKLLEEMVEEDTETNTDFEGMTLLKLYPEGDIECKCKKSLIFSKEQLSKIKQWIVTKGKKEIYSEGFHRLDLGKHILIFKVYDFNKNKLLFGHVLTNNWMVKMNLLESRQNFLMRNFL